MPVPREADNAPGPAPQEHAITMDRPSSADLIVQFEQHQRARYLSELTIARRTFLLRRLARQHDLATITGEELARWLSSGATKKLIAATRRAYLADLKAFYEWAWRVGHIAESPLDHVDLQRVKVPRRVPRPIDDRELLEALAVADPRMRCWLLLAALAGLRCKEIAGLAAEHLIWHLDPPLIAVENGKGGHARTVPMAKQLEEALRLADLPRSGWLFTMPLSGEPVTPSYVSHRIALFLHAHGSSASAHRLRHYFATRLYMQTQDLRAVQELLGHQSPTTTAIYAQYADTAAAKAVRTLRV